jgi:hypothetical protein
MIASKESFASIVDSIPASLEMTYRNFLSSVPRGHEQLAASLLRLVLGSMRPLTLDEINIAFTIEWEDQSTEEILSRCHFAISNLLQETLGPLVRISESRVLLIHQTAKEFLLNSSTEVGINGFPVRVDDCDLQLSDNLYSVPTSCRLFGGHFVTRLIIFGYLSDALVTGFRGP